MSERHPDGQVTREVRGNILLMGIDRAEKYNGLTPKIFEELTALYNELDTSPTLRVGILFGHGKHFTAGLDLPKFVEHMKKGERSYMKDGQADVYALRKRCSKPIVVAVHGITYTAGIEMMLAADIAIAASDCRFSQLEAKRGIMAAGGATFRFVQRGGWGNAMYHLLTCDEFTAQEALRCGFVQEVVEPGKQLDRAIAIAEQIARMAPLAIQATKANAARFLRDGEAACIGEFESIQKRMSNSEDAAEGVRSFIERREPNFQGR